MKIKVFLITIVSILFIFYINISKKENIKDDILEESYSGETVFNSFNNSNPELNKEKTSSDLQMIIYKSKENDIITLDSDYYLTYSLIIEKNITIDMNGHKIYGKDLVNFFTFNGERLEIKNGTFFMIDTNLFLQSSRPNNTKEIKIKNNSFFLEKESVLSFNMDNVLFENNYVSLEKNHHVSECRLIDYNGTRIILKENFFFDKSKKCRNGINLTNQNSSEIISNVIISYLYDYIGVISLSNSFDSVIKNNLIIDLNNENRIYTIKAFDDKGEELLEDEQEFFEGSISVKLSNVSGIELSKNKFYSTEFVISENSNEKIEDNVKINNLPFNEVMSSKVFFECSFIEFIKNNDIYQTNKFFELNNCK